MVASLKMLKNNGIYGVIVPSVFLYQSDFQSIREYFFKHHCLFEVVDLGDGRFKGVTAPSCIILIKKSTNKTFDINIIDSRENSGISKDAKVMNIKQIEANNYIIPIIKDNNDVALIDFMSMSRKKIDDLVTIVNSGVCTGNDKAFIDEIPLALKSIRLQKCLKGKDINDFSINYSNRKILYIDRETDNLEKNEIEYLKNFREVLLKRSEVKNGTYSWFHLNRPRSKDYFENFKIILRQTSDTLIGTYDDQGFYVNNSVIIIKLKENSPNAYKYLLGLLLSKSYRKMYNILVNEEGRVFPEVKPNKIKSLPFLELNTKDANEVIKLVDQLLRKYNEKTKEELDLFIEKSIQNELKVLSLAS